MDRKTINFVIIGIIIVTGCEKRDHLGLGICRMYPVLVWIEDYVYSVGVSAVC